MDKLSALLCCGSQLSSSSAPVAAVAPAQHHHQQQEQQEMQNLMHDQQHHHQANHQQHHQNNNSALSNKENQQRNSGSSGFPSDTAGSKQSPAILNDGNQQRHSQPEFGEKHQQLYQTHRRNSSRPLSESNSEISCDMLSASSLEQQQQQQYHSPHNKSNNELSLSNTPTKTASNSPRYSGEPNTSGDDAATKRSSVNSTDTASGGSGSNSQVISAHSSERKRALPKHQRPLTRYLPIFSPDLNLRQHIESAGHQIGLCPHVFVDAYSCRGYLHKLGATFHGWARRWFVLDRQRSAFIYYADKSERKPRGGAYFSTIDEVYLDHLNTSKSGRPHCTFIVKTKKRSYHLQAASDAAARIWIDAIITGAQGNLDY